MSSLKHFRVVNIIRRDVFWAMLFLLLMASMYLGVEWLVWVVMVPLILIAVRGSPGSMFFIGSIVVLLNGYLWLGWLKLYNNRTLVIGLACWYLFYMFFVLATRFLCKKGNDHLNISFQNNGDEKEPIRHAYLILVPSTIWFCMAKMASFTDIGSSWTDLAMFQP